MWRNTAISATLLRQLSFWQPVKEEQIWQYCPIRSTFISPNKWKTRQTKVDCCFTYKIDVGKATKAGISTQPWETRHLKCAVNKVGRRAEISALRGRGKTAVFHAYAKKWNLQFTIKEKDRILGISVFYRFYLLINIMGSNVNFLYRFALPTPSLPALILHFLAQTICHATRTSEHTSLQYNRRQHVALLSRETKYCQSKSKELWSFAQQQNPLTTHQYLIL